MSVRAMKLQKDEFAKLYNDIPQSVKDNTVITEENIRKIWGKCGVHSGTYTRKEFLGMNFFAE